jgi:hypothetical protein
MKEFLSNKHTPPDVKEAIYMGLYSWLEPIEKVQKDFGVANKANIQQDILGWRHFIRGRLSIEWGICIHQYAQQQKFTGLTQEQWGAQVLAINWKYILKLWNERNIVEHGETNQDQEAISKSKMIEEIENIFNQNQDTINRSVTSFDIAELETMNTSQLTTYLYSMKIIVTIQKQKDKQTKWQSIEKFTRKRQKKKCTKDDKSELDPGELVA